MLRWSHRSFGFAVFGCLAALTVACSSARRPTYNDPNVLFQDDFTDPSTGWDVHTDSLITTTYDSDQYLMAYEDTGKNIWALPGLDLKDLVMDVDTDYVAGPDNNEYGVMCRYTVSGDKHSFYFFFISSDGFYAMGKVVKNKRTILNPTSGDFQPASAVKTDKTATNHLTATCNGDKLSFAINGAPAGDFTDDDLAHGDIGLIIGTYDEGGVKIHFDNVMVKKP